MVLKISKLRRQNCCLCVYDVYDNACLLADDEPFNSMSVCKQM